MVNLRGGPALALEVIDGMKLAIPSNRTPAGLYVMVSTPYGQCNTTIKAAMADCSVAWNETLTIYGLPLRFPPWLMPIFSRKSKAVHLEIRASFESGPMLGRGELVGKFETTFEKLLGHHGQLVSLSAVDNQCISIRLKARRLKTTQIVDHAAGCTEQSEIGSSTDEARDAYTLFGRSNLRSDLHSSILGFQSVLDQCPPGHPDRAAALSNLAHAVLCGYAKNIRTDIDHAISLFRSALNLRPPGHPDHLLSNIDLCKALHYHHSHEKGHVDLREAMDLSRYVLPLCTEGSYLHRVALDTDNILHATQISTSQHSEWHHDQPSPVQSTEIPGPERRQSPLPPSTPALLSNRETRPRGRNVVIFGETGSGKSSVINTIAQKELAKTSNDAPGCTSISERHQVEISGQSFVLFDTAGLNEGTGGTVPAAKAEKQLKNLLRQLMRPGSDGIGLLVYCVHNAAAPHALARDYNIVYAEICRKKVPIVLVTTGLERETRMESWWDTNGEKFKSHGMHFTDHACVTALQEYPGMPGVFIPRIAESSKTLCDLVFNNCSDWTPTMADSSVLRERGACFRRGQRTE